MILFLLFHNLKIDIMKLRVGIFILFFFGFLLISLLLLLLT